MTWAEVDKGKVDALCVAAKHYERAARRFDEAVFSATVRFAFEPVTNQVILVNAADLASILLGER